VCRRAVESALQDAAGDDAFAIFHAEEVGASEADEAGEAGEEVIVRHVRVSGYLGRESTLERRKSGFGLWEETCGVPARVEKAGGESSVYARPIGRC